MSPLHRASQMTNEANAATLVGCLSAMNFAVVPGGVMPWRGGQSGTVLRGRYGSKSAVNAASERLPVYTRQPTPGRISS